MCTFCDSKWYVQVDKLAMGSKLAVYLANIWKKQFEDVISGRGSFTTPGRTQSAPDPGGSVITSDAGPRFPCGSCGDNVGRASVQCRRCGFWYHRRCTNLSVVDLRRLSSGSGSAGVEYGLARGRPLTNRLFPLLQRYLLGTWTILSGPSNGMKLAPCCKRQINYTLIFSSSWS